MTVRGMLQTLIVGIVSTGLLTIPNAASAVSTAGSGGHQYAQAVCGTVAGTVGGKVVSVPAATQLTSAASYQGFVVQNDRIYAMDYSGRKLTTWSTGGTPLASYAVAPGPFAVDPAGNSFTVESTYGLVKHSPDGLTIWKVTLPAPISALAGVPGDTWRLIAILRDRTQLVDVTTGALQGTVQVVGSAFGGTTGSGLISTDGHYVRRYDAALNEALRFGSAADANAPQPDGAPLHFHILGGAAQLNDGRYLVTDSGRGIWLVNADGIPLGLAPEAGTGPITQASSIAVIADRVVYISGNPFTNNQQIVTMPLQDLLALTNGTPPATGPRLGFGAGLATPVAGNYFAAGVTPRLTAYFEDSWKRLSGLTLQYTVRSAFDVSAGLPGDLYGAPVTTDAMTLGIDLALPQVAPGAYEVDAHLFRNGVQISATCAHYAIGAPRMTLDLASLPGTSDAGGPNGARGVALADTFGLGAHRLALDWNKLLDANGNTTFAAYDADVQAAAAEAARRHVMLSVQLGSGGPERAFVDNGTWGSRVQQVIAHFAPYVDYWEAWNEPNLTYGSASNYVSRILGPFSDAVTAADPSAKRIGGTVAGIQGVPYWQQIIASGGLKYMDIAAIHPYPGHNRSFEEEGFVEKIQQAKALFAVGGKPDLPIWITEFAFWSNGPANWFTQADKTVRAKILSASLGIDNWEYFITQGTWGNNGVSFSLIEGNQVVKPAAVALMAARDQLAGRTFQGWTPTGVPHVYVARYGPSDSDAGSVLALWSDDATVPLALTGPAGTAVDAADEYGGSQKILLGNVATSLPVTGSVQYVHEPAGVSLTVGPQEEWGANLALASESATATATSQGGWNPAARANDGVGSALGQGDFRSSSAWASAPGDAQPAITVTFSTAHVLDRVVVATSSIGSVLPGIRDADLAVQGADGAWLDVAQLRNQFTQRTNVLSFAAATAKAIRLTVRAVNLSGYDGGAAPWFWPTDAATLQDPTQPAYGPAIVREIEAYGPGRVTATVPNARSEPPTPVAATTQPAASTPDASTAGPGYSTTEAIPAAAPLTPSAPSLPSSLASQTPPQLAPSPAPAPPATKIVQAPQPPAKVGTALTSAAGTTVRVGQVVATRAVLRVAGGRLLAGSRVRVLVRAHGVGKWTPRALVTTDAAGRATFRFAPRTSTDVLFAFPGAGAYAAAQSRPLIVLVARQVSLRSSAQLIARGRLLTLQGVVSPEAAGVVYIQQFVAGSWGNVGRADLTRGAFRYDLRPRTPGAILLRAYRPGDRAAVASVSRALSIGIV